ncbi:MAG: MBL fold metallo-hydrolase [Chitinophagaceae bacterium]
MSLFITSLNSGSNGNCYYIGNDNEAILVDAGISCLETEKRMKRSGLHLDKVKAIFISHEHKDHIGGVAVLAKKYKLPVYITEGTQQYGKVRIEKQLIHRFAANEAVVIGDIRVTAFKKNHDASDPHSFTVACKGVKIGIFTDIGIVCNQLVHHFQQCNAAFLEANYDVEMLATGVYPYYLKQRITNGKGHLSNIQALELFRKNKPSFMSHLILSHLSKNNNNSELVKNLFQQQARGTKIIIASREEETAIYHILPKGETINHTIKKYHPSIEQIQLSLF